MFEKMLECNNAIIFYYGKQNLWLYNRKYPKPKCGLLLK